jgi:hypothetical protein
MDLRETGCVRIVGGWKWLCVILSRKFSYLRRLSDYVASLFVSVLGSACSQGELLYNQILILDFCLNMYGQKEHCHE